MSSLRLDLHQIAEAHRLSPEASHRLLELAGLSQEPAGLGRIWQRGVAVLAASLAGLGVVLWIAANWDTLGRFGHFALLQFLILATGLGAMIRPALRSPLGLLAMVGIGGLFAYFGQTYQTGADAWQLFALWAVLALPLCLAARSDVLWAPWSLVAMTGISLWVYAHTGHRWRVESSDLAVHALGWGLALLMVAGLSRLASGYTGAGIWALRTAATLTVIGVTTTALAGLFGSSVAPHYVLGLLLLGTAAAASVHRRLFDIFLLSALALGLDVLLVGGLARLIFQGSVRDPLGPLLMLGLTAAGLLAATVSGVLHLHRRQSSEEAA